MAKTINIADDKYIRKVVQYLSENKDIELKLDEDDWGDIEAVKGIVEGTLECVAKILGEEKSENEEVTAELPGYLEFKVSHREGADNSDGNWGLGVTAGSELKKRIKDDESLED